MTEQIKFERYLNITIVFSVISSLSVIIPMFKFSDEKNSVINIVGPLVFWIGLALEQFCIWKANALRKQILIARTNRRNNYGIGLISFMKTELGFFCDLCLAISVIVYLILCIGKWGLNITQYIFLFLIVLSFRLHCIANGKNYRYKKFLAKRKVNYEA